MYNDIALIYDKLTENVEYKRRACYVRDLLVRCGCPEGLLLDAGCGTGSMAAYMSGFGYDIICADNSPQMLSAAREKLPGGLFICQDLTRLDLYGTIKGTFCCLDTLNHLLTIGDVERAVSRIALFTEPGGAFVFDVNTVYKHRHVLDCNTFALAKGDVYCVWQNTFHPLSDVVDIDLDFFIKNGDTYTRSRDFFSERAYAPEALTAVLEKCGFRLLDIFDDMTFDKPRAESERLYFCAVRV